MSKRLKRRRKRRAGYWWGLLTQAVAADREERGEPPDLSEDEILGWADAFFASRGDWPTWDSGPIPESAGETWLTVAAALGLGLRVCPRVDRSRVSSPATGVDTTGRNRICQPR